MIKKLVTMSDTNGERLKNYARDNNESQSKVLDDILTMFFDNNFGVLERRPAGYIKYSTEGTALSHEEALSRYTKFDDQIAYAMKMTGVDPKYPKEYLNFTSQMITDVYKFLSDNGVATTRDSVHRRMTALYVV